MKKLVLVFTLASASFLISGCGSQKVAEKVKTVEMPVVQQETVKKKDEPKIVVYKNVADVRNLDLTTSATLQDDTGVGFNYEGKNLMDNDFSTSWCGTKKGIGDAIVYTFKEPVKAKKFGILPGFGRDEKIYFKNNRVKELGIVFTDVDGKMTDKLVSFPDKYQMDFVDLSDAKFQSVSFVVTDIYKGDESSDTCIAELDFWSDYVKNEDATAAMNYYNKYKEDEALRPKNIVSEVLISNNAPNECGTPVKSSSDFVYENGVSMDKYGMSLNVGDHVYASVVVNEFGKIGDKLTAKWYAGAKPDMPPGWTLVDTNKDVPVTEDCNGKLYLNVTSKKPFWGGYRIKFFNGEKEVGSANFSMAQ